MVAGGLLSLSSLFSTLMFFGIPQQQMFFTMKPDDAAEALMLFTFFRTLCIIQLALSAVVIFGAISLLNQKSYGWSMAGAISAIVGGLNPCGFGLLGWVFVVPIGIWVLIVLRKPEVKRLFSTGANTHEPAYGAGRAPDTGNAQAGDAVPNSPSSTLSPEILVSTDHSTEDCPPIRFWTPAKMVGCSVAGACLAFIIFFAVFLIIQSGSESAAGAPPLLELLAKLPTDSWPSKEYDVLQWGKADKWFLENLRKKRARWTASAPKVDFKQDEKGK